LLATTMIASACGSSNTAAPSTVTVHQSTVTVHEPTSAVASAPSAAQPAPVTPAAQSWTMPNLVGRNLQDAQDAIQALTDDNVFFSGSTDLTGQGRAQIMDRNWQVCMSTPPSGSALTVGTRIDFGVVRDSESCP
jgi:hypothetical protein